MPPPPLPKHHPSHTPENSAAIMQLKNDMADMFANFPGVTMERVFRALDNDHSGVLDQVEFMCGLADLGADVSQEDALKLFSAIDTDGSGQMDYMEFVNWFAAKSPPPPPARNGFRAQISSEEMATDIAQAAAARQQKQQVKQVISSEEMAASIKAASEKRSYDFMVKLKAEIKQMLDQSGLALERAFRAFDTDRDGSVDIFELTQGLQSLAPGISAEMCDTVFRMLDTDGDGTVDYMEFAAWFGNGPPPPPMLPQVSSMMAARAAAPSAADMMTEIQMAGVKRARTSTMVGINGLRSRKDGTTGGLKAVQTQDKSGPAIDHNVEYGVTEKKGLNAITGLIQYFPDTKQFLRKVEVNDKSTPNFEGFESFTGVKEQKGARAMHLHMIQEAAEKRTYRTMIKLKSELSGVMKASGVELTRLFREFDEDRNGTIDRAELKSGLTSLGAEVSEQSMDDMFSMLDKDGDGSVEYGEFARWFGAGPPPAPMTPEVKARQAARESYSMDGMDDHLAAIRGSSAGRATPSASSARVAQSSGSSSSPVVAVVAAMRSHLQNADVQYAGCTALWSLAYQNPANRSAIASSGGFQAIVEALRAHTGSSKVAEPACAALASLAVDDSIAQAIVSVGGVDAVTTAMMLHVGSAKVQEAALALLTNVNSQ